MDDHSFFQDNPYQSVGESDLEQHAHLALYLVMFLEATRDPTAGNWPGSSPLATLRNTCHAVEALYLTQLGHYSSDLIDAACAWLINLPDASHLSHEEEEELRLFPSRFKTLSWLGHFDEPAIRRDFEMLHQHLGKEGLIGRVLADPLLATLIYVDCLSYLAPPQKPASWQEGRIRALDAIARRLTRWERAKERPNDILEPGDLSYVMDVLIRAERLTDPDLLRRIRVALIDALRSDIKWTDKLYCGIQLAEYFPDDLEVKRAVRGLLRDLRERYERQAWRKEANFFHALVLRFLSTVYDARLSDELIRLLLTQEQRRRVRRQRVSEARWNESFAELIGQRLSVQINDVTTLAGGRAGTKIYRVQFCFAFELLDDAHHAHSRQQFYPNPSSLVIKVSETETLRRSIDRYHELPDEVRPYVARHAGEPFVVRLNGRQTGCLVMEDLTHMTTLDDLLQRLDQPALSENLERQLTRACEAVCHVFRAIHRLERVREFYGSQISRLYIAPIEEALNELTDSYPALKPWLRGFRLGQRRYPSISHYLHKIRGHESKLCLNYLMTVHGDAHSRNLMLDHEQRQAKLIDLDTLSPSGDYVQDCALLLEDVCIYRFLRDRRFRFYLDPEQIIFHRNPDDPKALSDGLVYPPPNAHSELSLLFQQSALGYLAELAKELDDECWQARLWLATATALLRLASHQRTLKRAAVLYVEAIKLLDVLLLYLDEQQPLPTLLFPGQQPAGVETREGSALDPSTPWSARDDLLGQLHRGLVALDPRLTFRSDPAGRIGRYYGTAQAPLFVLNVRSASLVLLLACEPAELEDPKGLAHPHPSNSPLRARVPITSDSQLDDALSLAHQVLTLREPEMR